MFSGNYLRIWISLGTTLIICILVGVSFISIFETMSVDATDIEENKSNSRANTIISTNTTWTIMNSPYNFTGNVLVENGVTLTIEPGVEVRFGNDNYLQIEGKLIADGTKNKMIKFTSNKEAPSEGDWDSILFKRNADNGSSIQYCEIEYALYGIHLDIGSAYSNSIITIAYNYIHNNEDTGIRIYFRCGSTLKFFNITNNLIAFNTGRGIRLQLYDSIDSSTNFEFNNNTIAYNKGSQGGLSAGVGIYNLQFDGNTNISFHNNNIYNNTPYNVVNYEEHYKQEVDFINNWWGSNNIDEINQSIYDYYDNFKQVKINYVPFLQSRVNISFHNLPPIAEASLNQSVIIIGQIVDYNGYDSNDPLGDLLRYNWDFGDGTSTGWQNDCNASHKYNKSGIYIVTLTVSDGILFDTDSCLINVTNQAPIANAGFDKEVKVNQTVYFDGSGSNDPDDDPLTYKWDFGDGASTGWQNDCNSSHKYDTSGNFTVTFTIYDDLLLDTDTCIVNVLKDIDPTPIIKPNFLTIIELNEDFNIWSLKLTDYETHTNQELTGDDLTWYVTGNSGTIFTILGDYSTVSSEYGPDTFVFKSIKNQYGTETLTYHLTDPYPWGLEATIDQTITVKPVNDATVLTLPNEPFHVKFDEPDTIDFSIYVSDVDNDFSELSITTDNSEYVTVSGLNLTFSFPQETLGETKTIKLTVSDGSLSSSDSIQVKITDNNRPEFIENFPIDKGYQAGLTYENELNLSQYFIDKDEEDLTYSAYTFESTNFEVTINNNMVTFVIQPNVKSIERVRFRASDPQDSFAEGVMTFTIWDVNNPPEISDIPDIYVHYIIEDYKGYGYDFSAFIFDPDNDRSELTVYVVPLLADDDESWYQPHPKFELGLLFKFPFSAYNDGESHPLYLYVRDPDGSYAYRLFSVYVVIDSWPVEQLEPIPDLYFDEDGKIDDALKIDQYLENKDLSGEGYEILDDPKSKITAEIDDNNYVDIYCKEENWYGDTEFVIIAKDFNPPAQVYALVEVHIIPVNDMPVISEIPEEKVNISEEIIIDLEYFINDVDTAFSELRIETNYPEYVTIINGTKLIVKFDKKGDYKISLTVYDGEFTVSKDFTISVIEEVDDEDIDDDDTPTKDKTSKSSFNIFPLIVLVILIIIILIILKITLMIFKNRHHPPEKPPIEDKIYGHLMHEILDNKKDTELSNDEFKNMLERKFQSGKMSPETYNYMKNFIQTREKGKD